MRDLLVLTNALTDLLRSCAEEEVVRRGLKKGHAHPNHGYFRSSEVAGTRLVHGGSPGNVAAGAAHLGLQCGMIGAVGTDEVGEAYVRDLEARGIENLLQKVDGASGMCWVLFTPDGERTMAVDLGVSPRFTISPDPFRRYRLFHTSGYELVSNPEATWQAIETARRVGAKFSFDVADAEMVRLRPEDLRRAAGMADLVFANETEARALTGEEPEESTRKLIGASKTVIVKLGARGAIIASETSTWRIPSQARSVIDTTGAGDAFAAGFLTGYLCGVGPEECGLRGSEFAARICGMEGARLPVSKRAGGLPAGPDEAYSAQM